MPTKKTASKKSAAKKTSSSAPDSQKKELLSLKEENQKLKRELEWYRRTRKKS